MSRFLRGGDCERFFQTVLRLSDFTKIANEFIGTGNWIRQYDEIIHCFYETALADDSLISETETGNTSAKSLVKHGIIRHSRDQDQTPREFRGGGVSFGTGFAVFILGRNVPEKSRSSRITMNRQRFFVSCLSLGLALAAFSSVATADVVFGNLGNSGTGTLGSSVTDFGNNPPNTDLTQRLAQGFTTGSSSNFLTVQSITLGLFGSTPPATPIDMSVGIYPNVGGSPGPSPVFTSGTVSIGDTARYTFSFSNVILQPSTDYWVIPSTPSTGSWVENFTSTGPIGRNSSGYTYIAPKRYGILDEEDRTSGWYPAPSKAGMSVSINAVPEPSTYAMGAVGVGLLGLARWRKRAMLVEIG